MEYRDFYQVLNDLLGRLAGKLEDATMREIRQYVDHGEEELGVDYLAAVLLHQGIVLSPTEYDSLKALLDDLGQRDGDFAPYLFVGPVLLGALNVVGRAGRRLELPPLRGGHESGSRRWGATEFPADWTVARIDDAALRVLRAESTTSARLANGHTLACGIINDLSIGVLVDALGAVRAAFPLRTSVLPYSRSEFADKDQPTLVELVTRGIAIGCGATLNHLAKRLPSAEVEAYRQLQGAGEWEELADALAASLIVVIKDAMEVRRHVRMMLCGFDLPVPGCEFINDRAAVLARLRVG